MVTITQVVEALSVADKQSDSAGHGLIAISIILPVS